MKKILIGILIAGLTSSSAFALKITQGKLLSHKEWTTGNIIKATYATHAELSSKDIEKLIYNQHKSLISGVYTSSTAEALEGKILTPTTATGSGLAVMHNGSKKAQTFTYTLQTCIDLRDGQKNCAVYEDMIEVEPDSMAFSTKEPSVQFTFDHAGDYPIIVNAYTSALEMPLWSSSESRAKMHISE
jgi:hypothetical protein